jgi:thiamine biosynthesis lipoprotein
VGRQDLRFRPRNEERLGTLILRLATQACGTRFELVLAGAESDTPAPGSSPGRRVSPQERFLRAAGEEALEVIKTVDHELSLFRRDSLLSRINRCAFEAPVRVGADTFELLAEALEVWRATSGAFDPALAPHMRAAGLQENSVLQDQQPCSNAPSASSIHLDAEGQSVRFIDPGVALDLGAIAKGHALDLAAECLREAGVDCALLHGGTSAVIALGMPPDTRGWPIALESKSGPMVHLCDRALALSSAAGKVSRNGLGHILDPRTGRGVPTDRAALVLASSARSADAWATALVACPTLFADSPWPAGHEVAIAQGMSNARQWQFSHPPGDDSPIKIRHDRDRASVPCT